MVNSSGNLVVNADTPQTLTVNNLLYLTSGSLDNSDPEVALTMADGSMIQRATGVMTNAPTLREWWTCGTPARLPRCPPAPRCRRLPAS